MKRLCANSEKQDFMKSRLWDLLRFAAAWSLFLVIFLFVTYPIFGDIHEGGHALACMALGGNVGGFRAWLHHVLPFANPPSTNCSIKPFPAAMWAAGPLTSIITWFTTALA